MGSKNIFKRALFTTILILVFILVFGIIVVNIDMLNSAARLLTIFIFSGAILFLLNLRMAASIENDIKSILSKFKSSTLIIEGNASQLRESSENLAMGSSRQAAAIEETSATMTETESMVAQNAENTRVAAEISEMAKEIANKGVTQMQDMIKAMDEIKESSDKVGKIVKAIDDIAFQTNLLAINATVEAARAGGDAGRSFGVVAEEVRNLAGKSAKEAANTTSIIEKNISLTNSGREISSEVANTLGDLMEKAQQLSQLISEVNTSSEQQAVSIKQINLAVGQMEKVTQENAAVAEENAASSNSMKDELVNLEQAIGEAGSILRDSGSAPVSISPRPVKSSSISRSAVSAPISRPATAPKAAAPVKRTEIPAVKSAPAPQPTKPAAKTQSDAEKIIPLDDNDDF